ncbi:MAG: VWA domain-containing protein [Sphingobacteriia bacterium]|nr:VWA domain-containing protein [Sphingobacteriia bacterium]
MSKLKDFTVASARPLPVIVLADVSGSMAADGKIEALNTALGEMIAAFAQEDSAQAEIHVAVIAFGAEARMHQGLAAAGQTQWRPMQATGRTPMGAGFDLARNLIEDRDQIPGRAYSPAIVLVSDGHPTDTWQEPLQRLLGSERAGKAQRFALGIGADADRDMLAAFLADPEAQVLEAHESRQIRNFFRRVTMSVSQRSRSATPNRSVMISSEDLDDFDDF